MPPRARPAVPGDVPDIERIVADAYRKYVPRLGRLPAPMLEDYGQLVAAGEVWVIETAHGPAGLIVLRPAPGGMLVANLAVAPERQRQGLGRRLLEFAEEETRRRGFAEMRLYTNALMTENVAMYLRLGWDAWQRAHEGGYDRVHFRKLVR